MADQLGAAPRRQAACQRLPSSTSTYSVSSTSAHPRTCPNARPRVATALQFAHRYATPRRSLTASRALPPLRYAMGLAPLSRQRDSSHHPATSPTTRCDISCPRRPLHQLRLPDALRRGLPASSARTRLRACRCAGGSRRGARGGGQPPGCCMRGAGGLLHQWAARATCRDADELL